MSFINKPSINIFINGRDEISIFTDRGTQDENYISIPIDVADEVARDLLSLQGDFNNGKTNETRH